MCSERNLKATATNTWPEIASEITMKICDILPCWKFGSSCNAFLSTIHLFFFYELGLKAKSFVLFIAWDAIIVFLQCGTTRKKLLEIEKEKTYTTLGDRAFQVAAPKLWNNLPFNIRSSLSLPSFKKALKTHLFREVFS